jgi:hypothetical protein
MPNGPGGDSINSGLIAHTESADSIAGQPKAKKYSRIEWVWRVCKSRWFQCFVVMTTVVVAVIILEASKKNLTDIMFIGGIFGAVSVVRRNTLMFVCMHISTASRRIVRASAICLCFVSVVTACDGDIILIV